VALRGRSVIRLSPILLRTPVVARVRIKTQRARFTEGSWPEGVCRIPVSCPITLAQQRAAPFFVGASESRFGIFITRRIYL